MSFRRPVRHRAAAVLAAMAALSMPISKGSANANPSGIDEWRVLHRFERQALKDYLHHIATSDVVQRGQLIMKLARSPSFARLGANCRGAAEALSYMVAGYYYSAQRLEVAFDWHHFRGPYLKRRGACLKDLGLDHRAFPLPYWFLAD
jgi:hypothetical protein